MSPRRSSYVAQVRGQLYTWARLLGDVRAIQTGTVPTRVLRRLAGRATGRALGRLFR